MGEKDSFPLISALGHQFEPLKSLMQERASLPKKPWWRTLERLEIMLKVLAPRGREMPGNLNQGANLKVRGDRGKVVVKPPCVARGAGIIITVRLIPDAFLKILKKKANRLCGTGHFV